MGHRGAFLLFLALLDILMGYSLLTATRQSLASIDLILSPQTWGVIWVGTGAFIATGVFAKKDRAHFGLAATLKTGWAAVWVNVQLIQHTPGTWPSIVLWLAFAAICVVVSSWPELHKIDGQGKSGDG